MKKLLYFIPFVLIGLSLTPFAIYQDTVRYGESLDTLSPSHWRSLGMYMYFSVGVDSSEETDPNQSDLQPEALSEDASFRGFPFGAYFANSKTSEAGSIDIAAFSLLWAPVNLFIVILSFVFAFKANRKATNHNSS